MLKSSKQWIRRRDFKPQSHSFLYAQNVLHFYSRINKYLTCEIFNIYVIIIYLLFLCLYTFILNNNNKNKRFR